MYNPYHLTLRFRAIDQHISIDIEADDGAGNSIAFHPPFGDDLPLILRALDVAQLPAAAHAKRIVASAQRERLTQLGYWQNERVIEDIHARVGRALLGALLAEPSARVVFASARNTAATEDRPLEILLFFPANAAALADLPWEALWDDAGETAGLPLLLAQGKCSSYVRRLMLPQPLPRPRPAGTKIKLLALSPLAGIAPELLAYQRSALKQAIDAYPQVELLAPEPPLTIAKLLELVERERPDLLSFYGHGDQRNGTGHLLLDTAQGGSEWVAADRLTPIAKVGVKLLMLQACRSDQGDGEGLLTGTAALLNSVGLPAIIAIQSYIRVGAAARLQALVCGGLAASQSVQEALAWARAALYAEERDAASWYVPTLTIANRNDTPFYLLNEPDDPAEQPQVGAQELVQAGVRRGALGLKERALGVAGVSTVALLAAAGLLPLLTGGFSAAAIAGLLASFGGNALSGWLTQWAEKHARRALWAAPEVDQALNELAASLDEAMQTNRELADQVGVLIEQTAAIPAALDALDQQIDRQTDLLLGLEQRVEAQGLFLQALRADLRRSNLIQGKLHHLLIVALQQQTSQLVDAYATGTTQLSGEVRRVLAEVATLRDEMRELAKTSALAALRTADATEQIVITGEQTNTILNAIRTLLEQLVQGQRELPAVFALLAQYSSQVNDFDLYQAVSAGLGRGYVTVTVDNNEQVKIEDERGQEKEQALPLVQLISYLTEVRQRVIADTTAQALAVRRERYRELMVELFHNLKLEGLSSSTRPITLPLERVFVQLRAVAEVPEAADTFSPEERRLLRMFEEAERHGKADSRELEEARLRLDALRRERWTSERLERFPISKMLGDQKQRGLVILGDPGSGKSTLLQFLALVFAQGPEKVHEHLKVEGADGERLPIFAPLASFDDMLNHDPQLSIQEFLPRYYDQRRSSPGLAPVFDQAIETGRALILLDGLDEVIEEPRRQMVAEQVRAFLHSAIQRGNRVVITSRIYGYRAAPLPGEIPHITVLDFGGQEIELFARQWFRALVSWEKSEELTPQLELEAQRQERELLDDIRSNPGVERLAVNPLLLTMLTLLRRQVGRLPQKRILLYNQYVTALVESWETMRSRGARMAKNERVDLREAEEALVGLALWLQQARASGTADRETLLERLTEFYAGFDFGIPLAKASGKQKHAAYKHAESFLHDMRHYSGLLIERGQNAFGFRHLTFQEYFAARALASMHEDERWRLIEPNLHSGRWREPLLLAVARLGTTDKAAEATRLVEQVLNASSEAEELLHRDLFLAADCAIDDVGVAVPILQRITQQLITLLDAPVASARQASMQRLYELSLLRSKERLRVPEALEALVKALPVEQVFGFSSILNIVFNSQTVLNSQIEREILQMLYASHPELTQSLFEHISDENEYVRAAVVEALGSRLQEQPELVGVLQQFLSDESSNVRAAVVHALASRLQEQPELVGVLQQLLSDESSNVREAVVEALASRLQEQPELVGVLQQLLSDESSNVRAAVVRALGSRLAEKPELVGALLEYLSDESSNVRVAVVQVLGSRLVEQPELVRPLQERLPDENENVRAAVVEALGSRLAELPELVEALFECLSDPASNVRAAVVEALGSRLTEQPELAAVLLERLSDPASNVRAAVAAVFTKQATGQRLSFFEQAIRHRDPMLRGEIVAQFDHSDLCADCQYQFDDYRGIGSGMAQAAIVQSLQILLPVSDVVSDALQEHFSNESSKVRAAVVRALGSHLAEQPELAEVLLERLSDESSNVRAAVVEVLGSCLAEQPELVEVLLERLSDESSNVRAAVVRALGSRLAEQPELLGALFERLSGESLNVRAAVIRALGRRLTEHPELLTTLQERLSDESSNVRAAVVRALGNHLAEQPELTGVLQERLSDDDNDVRAAVVRALGSYLAEQPELVGVLQERLSDESSNVRAAVVRALGSHLVEQPELTGVLQELLVDEQDPNVRISTVTVLLVYLSDELLLESYAVTFLGLEQSDSLYYLGNLSEIQAIIRTTLAKQFVEQQRIPELIAMLGEVDWRRRKAAAEILRETSLEILESALPQLLVALKDTRGYDAYHAHIAAAERLINVDEYSNEAIDRLLDILVYGADELVQRKDAIELRKKAGLALGNLKAAFRQRRVVEQVSAALRNDPDPQVRDALYKALGSLVAAPELE